MYEILEWATSADGLYGIFARNTSGIMIGFAIGFLLFLLDYDDDREYPRKRRNL